MKKRISAFCAGITALSLTCITPCAYAGEVNTAKMDEHVIGVLVYNLHDEEVQMFRNYLHDYIQECFPDVTFLYSDSIISAEEEMDFIQDVSDAGAEGILSFNSYDLEAEVKLCEENEVYYMMASASVADDDFAKVENNPYFLGVVGPGKEIEYEAGQNLAQYFYDQKTGNDYFLLSGGASMGNEMHRQRTVGILDTLQENYGVTFEQSSEALAASKEVVAVTAGDLSVCICPGYIDFESFLTPAKEAFAKGSYTSVLSVLPVGELIDSIHGTAFGLIDSYNERNMQLFSNDELSYVTGKFSSIIGPSFAAMYNAVTGYAEDFRENGKAFQCTQGFWTSESAEDYAEKYALSCGIELNAYNFEDLYDVCKRYNPDAVLEDLKTLTEAYSFEEAEARRAE